MTLVEKKDGNTAKKGSKLELILAIRKNQFTI